MNRSGKINFWALMKAARWRAEVRYVSANLTPLKPLPASN
jgi:hypothetical protein